MAIPHGRFVWYDLMTADPKAAEAFYTSVVGWGTTRWDGPMPYTMWTNAGAPIGGVMVLPVAAGAPAHWIAYISSPDTDATVAQAKALGADVMVEPRDVPEVGRFSVLSDPQGAMFAVYTPARDEFGHDGPPQVGEFSWHELATTDLDAAVSFYTTLFGWDKTSAFDVGGGSIYQEYGRNGQGLGGMFKRTPEMLGPSAWLYYIMVDDDDAAAERVTAAGGTVLNGPMDVPGGDRIAHCLDSQGAGFAVHARAKAA